jgi:putative endonuclease
MVTGRTAGAAGAHSRGEDGGSNRSVGGAGERIAAAYLRKLGWRIVEVNYRFGRGEIDIVARDGATLVFCEVKLRTTDEFGLPETAVTARKQRQIRFVAQGYMLQHDIRDSECRFDVVGIRRIGEQVEICHLPNAF